MSLCCRDSILSFNFLDIFTTKQNQIKIHTYFYVIIIISFVPDQLNLALGREAFVNRPNVILFHSAAPFWLPIFGYWGHYCTRSVYIMYPGPPECMRTWGPVLAIFWQIRESYSDQEGADYAHQIGLSSPNRFTFRRLCCSRYVCRIAGP